MGKRSKPAPGGTLWPAAALLLLAAVASVCLGPVPAWAGGGVDPGGGSNDGSPKTLEAGSIAGVPRAYARFTVIVVRRTGLSARVVAGWTLAEGGPKDNPLNIGPGERFGTVRRGARSTARHLRGDLYRDVMNSVGRTDMAQIEAIAASPWCYRCKGYRRLLRSTYRRVHVDD